MQRVSCYIQHKMALSDIPLDEMDIKNPYVYDENANAIVNGDLKDRDEYIPRLGTLDNGNVIIIFDNSHSGSIEDTLIAARGAWECRWRRLPFHLAFESKEKPDANDDDKQLALHCAKAILSDVFKAVIATWDGFLDKAVTHVSILEDGIYEQPADETRAPELWANSSLWLKVEKLLNVHVSVVQDMRTQLHELAGGNNPNPNPILFFFSTDMIFYFQMTSTPRIPG